MLAFDRLLWWSMPDMVLPGGGTFGPEGKGGIVLARRGREIGTNKKNNTIEASMLLKKQVGK
jgi:hypothetical protein